MTTIPPSGQDGDRPLFADSLADSPGGDRPFDAPVIRRRAVTDNPGPAAPSRPSTSRVVRPPGGPVSPPSPPAATPSAAPPARRGILIGRINGQVTATSQQRHFYGLATLLAIVMATVAGLCLYTTGVTFLVILVAMVILMVFARMFMGAWGLLVWGIVRGLVRLIVGVGLLFARGAGHTARGTVQATTSSREVAFRRFQIQLISGEYLTCLMVGEPTSDDPKKDDHVGISGRARKDHFAVRSVEIFSGPAGQVVRRVRAKHPLDVRIMRWLDRGSFVLAALIVAGAISLVW